MCLRSISKSCCSLQVRNKFILYYKVRVMLIFLPRCVVCDINTYSNVTIYSTELNAGHLSCSSHSGKAGTSQRKNEDYCSRKEMGNRFRRCKMQISYGPVTTQRRQQMHKSSVLHPWKVRRTDASFPCRPVARQDWKRFMYQEHQPSQAHPAGRMIRKFTTELLLSLRVTYPLCKRASIKSSSVTTSWSANVEKTKTGNRTRLFMVEEK